MTISASCIDAKEAEEILLGRGLSHEEEGFNNPFFDVWRNRETGEVYSVAYCRHGDKSRYSREAFEKVLEELGAG
jgi:hypothetical protein